MSANFPYFRSGPAEELEQLHKSWRCLLAIGITLIVVGALAICYPVAATITTVELFGILLLMSGVVEIASGIWARRWAGFFPRLLCGLLYLFLGVVLLDRPLLAATGYTLVMAVFFVASGLFRVVLAVGQRFSGWAWVALNGAITLLLGVLIWRDMPESALWVIGTFVGIDLVFSGLSWVMVALSARALPLPEAPGQVKADGLVGV
jgi:uncharacterized membrane protein HdeD (DUF308 family)